MKSRVSVIFCLLLVAASLKASFVGDVVASVDKLAKDPQIQHIVSTLSSLQKSALGEKLDHCISQTVNDYDMDTCSECEEGYMAYCKRRNWTYYDSIVCTCTTPKPDHCSIYYEAPTLRPNCTKCFEGYTPKYVPVSPDSKDYDTLCVKATTEGDY